MIDFKFNYPSLPEETMVLQEFLSTRSATDLQQALIFPSYQGKIQSTRQLGELLHLDWETLTATSELVVCTSANQALYCLLQGLRPKHNSLLTETFTYSAFKTIAQNNQYHVLSVPIDQDGLDINRLAEMVTTKKAKLLYIQPTIQNPTCAVLTLEKREQLVTLAKEKDLLLIEDDAYRFLHPDPPPTLLQLVPERTIHIYSLAKPFNPLIKVTFVILPIHLRNMMVEQVRLTSSGTSALLIQLADHLLSSGALASFINKKRTLAKERQQAATSFLEGFSYQTYSTSFHTWLTLPQNRNATEVTASLSERGLQVASGMDCSFLEDGERYIRIAFGAVGKTEQLEGLHILKDTLTL